MKDAEALFLISQNSAISSNQSEFTTTNSATFVVLEGSSLRLEESSVKADSPVGIFVLGSNFTADNSSISNTVNSSLILHTNSSGTILKSDITTTNGNQAVEVFGSHLRAYP
jgi:hypothetical protein